MWKKLKSSVTLNIYIVKKVNISYNVDILIKGGKTRWKKIIKKI